MSSVTKKIGTIQGIRALAVLGVIFYHAHFSWAPGGFLGVDTFFVISGFLISQLILRELESTNDFSFTRFYTRRIRRLLPVAALVTLTTIGIGRHLISPLRFRALGWDAVATTLYGANYRFYFSQVDYLNLGTKPSLLLHYWSLAVEEQFYLLWPLLLVVGFTLFKKKGATWTIGAVTIISFTYSVFSTRTNPTLAFYSLPTRAWEFGVGALTFLGTRRLKNLPEFIDPILGWIGAGAVFYSFVWLNDQEKFPGTLALIPVLGAALLLAGSANGIFFGSLLLRNPLAVGVGEISYSLYLWHWPIYQLMDEVLGRNPRGAELTLYFALTFAFSILTYIFVENPVRNYKRLAMKPAYGFSWGAITTGITLGAALSLVGLQLWSPKVGIANASTQTNSALKDAIVESSTQLSAIWPSLDTPISQEDLLRASFDSSCMQTFSSKSNEACIRGDSESEKTIALFGDSHAEQWMPALDVIGKREHLRIEVFTKAGCPAADLLVSQGERQDAYPLCPLWRNAVIQKLVTDSSVKLILLAAVKSYNDGTDVAQTEKYWRSGYTRTLTMLIDKSKRVLLLSDTPYPGAPPVTDCLAHYLANPQRCDLSRDRAVSINDRLQVISTVAAQFSVPVVDPVPWLCDSSSCPAVINGDLVYADNSHLSARFSEALAPLLWKKLLPLVGGGS